jgi:hypothetical protein
MLELFDVTSNPNDNQYSSRAGLSIRYKRWKLGPYLQLAGMHEVIPQPNVYSGVGKMFATLAIGNNHIEEKLPIISIAGHTSLAVDESHG